MLQPPQIPGVAGAGLFGHWILDYGVAQNHVTLARNGDPCRPERSQRNRSRSKSRSALASFRRPLD